MTAEDPTGTSVDALEHVFFSSGRVDDVVNDHHYCHLGWCNCSQCTSSDHNSYEPMDTDAQEPPEFNSEVVIVGEEAGSCTLQEIDVADVVEAGVRLHQKEQLRQLQLTTQAGRVELVKNICKLENKILHGECLAAVRNAKTARSVDNLLQLPSGSLTLRPRNPVVQTFVEGMTATDTAQGSKQSSKVRHMRQQEAIECIYSGRDLRYVSEFHIPVQAVSYAVSGSKLVTDMIGHLAPGGSYQLVKEWLADMGSQPLVVPDGFITVGFDNEQRLLRNWLARGANRSKAEVLTTVLCAVHKDNGEQDDKALHRRHWTFPTANELQDVFKGVESILDHPEMAACLFDYLKPHLVALKEAGQADSVSILVEKEKIDAEFIKCPGCGSLMKKQLRNCRNPACKVKNVRAEIRKEAGVGVSTEVPSLSKKPSVGKGTVFSFSFDTATRSLQRSTGSVLSSGCSTSVCNVQQADIRLLEPCFVNPNSHEAVRVLLNQIGVSSGVRQCGGSKRHWLPVVCDGLPYSLMRHVQREEREKARSESLSALECPTDLDKLRKPDLKAECKKRGLSTAGPVSELRSRLRSALEAEGQLQTSSRLDQQCTEGKFDWVVSLSGGLHWEMTLTQVVIDVLWPFVYEAFAQSQGYTTPNQKKWARSGKDHHRAHDEMSRFVDGCVDELMRPYALQAEDPTPAGFFDWCKSVKDNLTFSWLLHMVINYAFSLMVFRQGMRNNRIDLFLSSRRLLSTLLHARTNVKYQLIELYEEVDRLAFPEKLRQRLDATQFLSRFVSLFCV